jgi:hypothetical protein
MSGLSEGEQVIVGAGGATWDMPPGLKIARQQAIEVTEAIIFQDREDSPHSLALTIVDCLIARWLIRG